MERKDTNKKYERIKARIIESYNPTIGDFASFFEYGKNKARYIRVDKAEKRIIVSVSYSHRPRTNLKNPKVRQRIASNLLELANKDYSSIAREREGERERRRKSILEPKVKPSQNQEDIAYNQDFS